MQPNEAVNTEALDVPRTTLESGSKSVIQAKRPPPKESKSATKSHSAKTADAEYNTGLTIEDQNDRIGLSEPGYRNVAGGVTRKSGNMTRAESPPPNPPRSAPRAQNRQPRRKGQRMGRNRANDGSDSDSDSDSDRRRNLDNNNDAPSVSRRQTAQSHDTPGEGEIDARARRDLAREEAERMRLFQVLRGVGEKWKSIQFGRGTNTTLAKSKMERCIHRYEELLEERHGDVSTTLQHSEYQSLQDNINKWDANLKNFLDEAMYGDVEEKLREEGRKSEGAGKPLDYLEDVFHQVELGIILRCTTDEYLTSHQEWPMERILHFLKITALNLTMLLSPHLRDHGVDATSDANNIVQQTCPASQSPNISSPLGILENAYLIRLVQEIVTDFENRPANENAGQIDNWRLLTIIERSRPSGRLTREYVEWVCSDVPMSVIEQCCIQWRRDLRAKTVQTYRDTMKSIVELRQEFCPGIVDPGVVSLVLFKGNYPASVRNVDSSELNEMGWFLDRGSDTSQPSYSRYARHALEDGISLENVFRVHMDGRVLGIMTPEFGYLKLPAKHF